jgi:hypothetical protein
MGDSVSYEIQKLNRVIKNICLNIDNHEWLKENCILTEDSSLLCLAVILIDLGKKLMISILTRDENEKRTKLQRIEAVMVELKKTIDDTIELCQKPTPAFQKLLNACLERSRIYKNSDQGATYQKVVVLLQQSPYKTMISYSKCFKDAYELLISIPVDSSIEEHRKLLLFVEAIHSDPLLVAHHN